MDTEHNQSDRIMPFTPGEIPASPRASPRMQLERATSIGNMDLGVSSTSPRELQHMELEEASTVRGLEMGECSISPRVLRHMLFDEANIGRTLELDERLSSPRVLQYVQLEEGVVAGRLELGQCSSSWLSPRDLSSCSPYETSTSGSLEGHKSPLLTSPAFENTDLWEDLKAKWEIEQWKRGLRLQMALENIEKCGGTQQVMPRQNAGCPSQNLNRQACDVPKPNACSTTTPNPCGITTKPNTRIFDTSSYGSTNDNNSSWFNPLDKIVKNTNTCSTNTCSTSTDTLSDGSADQSKWYSPLDRHWI